MFVDEVKVEIEAGRGGHGMLAWRREKYVPFGGPSGGDGGRGGSVIVRAVPNLTTLLDLRYKKKINAENGRPGGPKNMHGRKGEPTILRVPVGTQVFDVKTDELMIDLVELNQEIIVAVGGRGGRGNARFVSSTNRAPSYAEEGHPGGLRTVRLELKLLADVGIIGYPSVGKSTIISVISNARPRIAAYPFTTLVPNLGVVGFGQYQSFVVADIPGLIEGAAEGKGLGYQFLRHVERCALLVHVLEVPPPFDDGYGGDWSERDPILDFERINRELALFNPALAERPQIVVLNKADLPFAAEQEPALRAHFEGLGFTFHVISSATRLGIGDLVKKVGERVFEMKEDY
jgi:GTP-binding protein